MSFTSIQKFRMIEQLEKKLRKIKITNQIFKYEQNHNEFMSILIVLNNTGLNASLSLAQTLFQVKKSQKGDRINSIIQNQRKFADGTPFESYFRENNKIGKV